MGQDDAETERRIDTLLDGPGTSGGGGRGFQLEIKESAVQEIASPTGAQIPVVQIKSGEVFHNAIKLVARPLTYRKTAPKNDWYHRNKEKVKEQRRLKKESLL